MFNKFKTGDEVIFKVEEGERIGIVEKVNSSRTYAVRIYGKNDIYGDLFKVHENDMRLCLL